MSKPIKFNVFGTKIYDEYITHDSKPDRDEPACGRRTHWAPPLMVDESEPTTCLLCLTGNVTTP